MAPLVLGALAVCIDLISQALCILLTLRRKIKPHMYTMLVWTIVTAIIFAGQIVEGAGAGAWVTGTVSLFSFVGFILSFKYGTKDVTFLDRLFLIGALGAIIPWVLTNDPFYSIALGVTIDMLGILPTLRKTWNDPRSERVLPWALAASKYFLSIPATAVFSFSTLAFPVEAFIMDMILIGIIVYRRSRRRRRI